jgi:hypothetical protein
MENHQTPSVNDWEAFVEDEKCINIKINESLDIADSKIKFLGKDREFLLEMKLNSRDVHICLAIGNPLFVELHTPKGVSVQYVKGSGKEHYKKLQEEQAKYI